MTIVRVALDVPLPRLFDYRLPQAMSAEVGSCVRVPFGRGEKTGVIVEFPGASDVAPERLKPVAQVLREWPAMPAEWLALVRFCARYYQAPLGEVAALALPPGLRRGEPPPRTPAAGQWVEITETGREALAAPGRPGLPRRVLERLAAEGPQCRGGLRELGAGADRVVGELLRKEWLRSFVPDPSLGRQHLPVGAASAAIGPDALRERPIAAEAAPTGSVHHPGAAQPVPRPLADAPPLRPAQQTVVAALSAALDRFQVHALHGVTGSGKTEVYLRLIEQVLANGRQALMLVPEIALTPQLEARVAGRFPAARLVSLHSGQPDGVRSRGFLEAQDGRADIVLGTRLAVFVPLPRLGIIVVDEEHDASFKQQDGIRYSARDVAVWRARERDVPILLGSATPSLETWHHARTGRYRLHRLPERAAAAALPKVRLVDTRRAKLDNGLSPQLLAALAERLARGEQSLVFLNRRGYAPVLACTWCGWTSRCRHCAANMVVHLADRRLRCHHCGAETSVPAQCPDCGNQDILPFGRGTQRLEAILTERLPGARVLRVDRDSARSPRQWAGLLEAIHGGRADILVGTQMLAKGHDFPRLTLVGVLGADASLHAADFRAPERLFAQLMQVGGRSGRADLPGEVLIQTDYPDHPLYRALLVHDYDGFAGHLLEERRQAGFPPCTFQAVLRAEAPQLADAVAFLQRAVALANGAADVQLYDPVPMRLARRADLERAQLLVESAHRGALQAFLEPWVGALYGLPAGRGLRWHIDVDPHEL